ncbi:MAG: hypothetical protein KBC41_03240 [Candidatus Pacebacteria bacterium]|nr:hypothetical protein [Candidatus Paceibacterota bacterium]MBP9867062.1 hypothetical protein [Candidatus Paceibacterota bacterium]
MIHIIQYTAHRNKYRQGFVLPFTLLIAGIMLLISVSISTILIKQIYFSNLGRDSQTAYYAADNALTCVLAIEDTYTYGISGIFPYDTTILTTEAHLANMQDKLNSINSLRALSQTPLKSLAELVDEIRCAQSDIFNTAGDSQFTVADEDFILKSETGVDLEVGQTSSFNMKMRLSDGTYRCARVTVNKTATYKQIISQGFSRCDRPEGSVERAIVFRTEIE